MKTFRFKHVWYVGALFWLIVFILAIFYEYQDHAVKLQMLLSSGWSVVLSILIGYKYDLMKGK